MTKTQKQTVGFAVYSALIFQALGSAATYLVAKSALHEIPPLVFGSYRFGLASLIFMAIMVIRRDHFTFKRADWPLLIWLAILAVPINQGFFLVGLSLTPPSHPALLYATSPVWVYLISAWRGEEHFTRRKSIGIVIALIGVTAFFLEKGIALALNDLLGDSFILIAVWAWAAYTVYGRPLAQRRGAVTVTASALILGTLFYMPLGLYLAAKFDYRSISLMGWSGIVYTAAVTSVLLYTLWYWIIKRMEPSKAAVFSNLQPVLTAVLSYFIMGEILSVASILSGLVILLGVYITQR
jgi:drug/metabolite transporter (DMT)-like permease